MGAHILDMKTSFHIPAHLCIRCRGTKMLCGLSYCPITVESFTVPRMKLVRSDSIEGSSPPSVFVGRYGYPKVRIYPSAPPVFGETSLYEDSTRWLSIGMEEFLSMRLSLVRGGIDISVNNASNPDSTFQNLQLLSMSGKPVELQMSFQKALSTDKIMLSEYVPPMGPSAPVTKFETGNIKIERNVEKVHYDTDLKAGMAMIDLYRGGQNVGMISKILSTGSIGTARQRKAVPTRWSITAVDKNISDSLVDEIKHLETVDKFLTFARPVNGNLFMGIIAPYSWRYEWGESWFPGSTWNYWGREAEVEIDYEDYWGRKDYPGIGGCYYASRLAVSEYLKKIGRQGSPILWREIYPGFNLPVGVWFVRENLRTMFNEKPVEFDTLEQALGYISGYMKVPLRKWLERSWVVPSIRSRTLESFL